MATSRGAVVASCVGVGLLAVTLVGSHPHDGTPLDPRSDGPQGTSALVSLLEQLDTTVQLSAGLPGQRDDVALLLSDRLDESQTTEVLGWVRGGGTLVVTDPGSSLVPHELVPMSPLRHDLPRGVCTIDALADVGSVDVGRSVAFSTATAAGSCLGNRAAAFVIATVVGSGTVVAVGGADAFTNDRLAHQDNAVLAAGLLSPRAGTAVRFVDPPIPAGGGHQTLYDLISDGVRRGALQLGLAFLLYAAWRAIRLGRPVREGQLVEVAGSELVGATGRLLERSRSPRAAADVLRGSLRAALRARLGVPPSLAAPALAELVARRAGVDAALARAALGDDQVTTDDELVAVAGAVASVHQEVLR